MSKKKGQHDTEFPDEEEPLPIGIKELPPEEAPPASAASVFASSPTSPSPTASPPAGSTINPAQMREKLKDGWEEREETKSGGRKVKMWVNRRDFKTKDGAVPQGVIRPLEEAYALESQRIDPQHP